MYKVKGAAAKVQIFNKRFLTAAALAVVVAALGACDGASSNTAGGVDPNETAASVNGKAITMEEVERGMKQQTQGQEVRMSPLELAGARLQVLQSLIEQEVMFQKAESEGTVPTDEEVAAEVNKRKVESRLSAEEFDRQMTQAGLDEKSFRENIKKGLAIQKLVEKVTGRIEPPRDSEIADFYKGNPEIFVRKRGVRLAAIVIDPTNSGNDDLTKNEAEAELRAKEVLGRLQQPGSDFAALAQEYSEDPSKLRGGDLGYFSEEELKQNYPQLAAGFMNPEFTVGRITNMVPIGGKGYIFKLTERINQDENLTLESPGVRQQVTDMLVNSRKQLLAASYQAIAMNEAKVENHLARKVVENPNELSGARPAGAVQPANASNANSAAANIAPPANANANSNSSAANTSGTGNQTNSNKGN